MLRREQKTMLSRGGTDPINKDYPKQDFSLAPMRKMEVKEEEERFLPH